MPDRPYGDHRRTRFRTLIILIALALAAVPAQAAVAKRHSSRPQVTSFGFSPASFSVRSAQAAAQSGPATRIGFTLSKRATVKVAIARKLAGRRARSDGRCVKPTRALAKRPACTRYRTSGTIVRSGLAAGQRAIGFSGRIGGRALATGTYRARIVAVDRSHHRSRAKTATFRVVTPQQASSSPPPAPTAPAPPGAQRRTVRPCTVTLPNATALQNAVSGAGAGSVVCLAPGSYGRLSLSGHAGGEVVVQPAGSATIAGATISGSHVTLEGFNITDEVDVQPGSDHATVQFNQIGGGYFGVNAGPTTTTTVNDVTIRANKFVGPFGEDAIRANRYHDSDGDGVGLLVEGNEITGVRENGNHSDCLQAVWVGDHMVFRRNYLHDNRCQGFFIKDQQSTVDTVVMNDNLMLRNAAACAVSGCGQPAVVDLFGPMANLTVSHNTIWTPEGGSPTVLQSSGWSNVAFDSNVIYRAWATDTGPFSGGYTSTNNVTHGKPEGNWPSTGFSVVASPPFADPAHDDYRTNDGRGVDWAPADQQYGP